MSRTGEAEKNLEGEFVSLFLSKRMKTSAMMI